MRKLLYLLPVLLVACVRQPDVLEPIEGESRDVAVAILRINTPSGGGSCTAWKVDEGILATAGHCCDEEHAEYRLEGPKAPHGSTAARLYSTVTPDVCMLVGFISGDPIRLAVDEPGIGEKVWTVGYPAPFGRPILLMSSGFWTGSDGEDGIASTVAIPGASGSPMLNSRGEAFGVLWGTDRRSYSVTAVTRLEFVKEALRIAQCRIGRCPPDTVDSE